jgi:hypothetical protein
VVRGRSPRIVPTPSSLTDEMIVPGDSTMPRLSSSGMALPTGAAFLVPAGVGFCTLAGPVEETPDAQRRFTVECSDRARRGHADEFIRLFRKNHLPVLKSLAEKGRIVRSSAVKPRHHGTEDGRWDYRVTPPPISEPLDLGQARIWSATLPATSVRRNSRPA